MRAFELGQRKGAGAVPLSIKVRVTSGRFHREHSPEAYALIDEWLNSTQRDGDFVFEEHESGPELLVIAAVASGMASAVASEVISAIVAILRARREGVERGDSPSDPLELIVRRVDADGVREEMILRVGHRDDIDQTNIGALVNDAISQASHPQRLIRSRADATGDAVLLRNDCLRANSRGGSVDHLGSGRGHPAFDSES